MKEKASRLAVLTKGIIKENPNLVLLLGTCPTLATTSSAFNGMGMGIAATAVLICSNIAISLLAKVIPDKVRIPCYIVLIAGFVTLVQFIVLRILPRKRRAGSEAYNFTAVHFGTSYAHSSSCSGRILYLRLRHRNRKQDSPVQGQEAENIRLSGMRAGFCMSAGEVH